MIKHTIFLLTLLCGILPAAVNAAQWAIVSAPDAISPEKTAASRLAFYLEKITGEKVELITEKSPLPADCKVIRLGQSELIGQKLGGIDFSTLKADEVILKKCGDELIVSGGRPRGVLYAVYTLLEDYWNCNFWYVDEYDLPLQKNLNFDGIDLRYAPPFEIRELYYLPLHQNGSPEFAAICRSNGNNTGANDAFGGRVMYAEYPHHTFYRLFGDDTLDTHPEWCSMVNGKRIAPRYGQLCLSNKELRKEFEKRARVWLQKWPNAQLLSITQNDNHEGCSCEECQKLLAAEKGRQSGVMLNFVNEIAAALEKDYPDLIIETFAYDYTNDLPVVSKPRKNVRVRLCADYMNSGFPVDSEQNKVFCKQVNYWSSITNTCSVWLYRINHGNAFLPYPNWAATAEDFRFYRDHHFKGVLCEGDYFTGIGDLVQLRFYLDRKLLWNPDLNQDELIWKFLRGYYGEKSAPFVHQYIETISNSMREKIRGDVLKAEYLPKKTGTYYDGIERKGEIPIDPNAMYDKYITCGFKNPVYLSPETAVKAYQSMDAAVNAAPEGTACRKRLERARVSSGYALLLKDEILNQPEKYGYTFEQLQDIARKTIQALQETPSDLGNAAIGRLTRRLKLKGSVRPDFLKDVPASRITILTVEDCRFNNLNRDVFKVEDEKSHSKVVGKMVNHDTWAIQCPEFFTLPEGQYKVYLRARTDAKLNNPVREAIAHFGCYYRPGYNLESIKVALSGTEFADGEYHYVELSPVTPMLKASGYLWISPTGVALEMKYLYVDEFIAVREK